MSGNRYIGIPAVLGFRTATWLSTGLSTLEALVDVGSSVYRYPRRPWLPNRYLAVRGLGHPRGSDRWRVIGILIVFGFHSYSAGFRFLASHRYPQCAYLPQLQRWLPLPFVGTRSPLPATAAKSAWMQRHLRHSPHHRCAAPTGRQELRGGANLILISSLPANPSLGKFTKEQLQLHTWSA